MIFFLKAIDIKVWKSVVNGYTLPAVVVDGVTVPKYEEQWTKEEELTST